MRSLERPVAHEKWQIWHSLLAANNLRANTPTPFPRSDRRCSIAIDVFCCDVDFPPLPLSFARVHRTARVRKPLASPSARRVWSVQSVHFRWNGDGFGQKDRSKTYQINRQDLSVIHYAVELSPKSQVCGSECDGTKSPSMMNGYVSSMANIIAVHSENENSVACKTNTN